MGKQIGTLDKVDRQIYSWIDRQIETEIDECIGNRQVDIDR